MGQSANSCARAVGALLALAAASACGGGDGGSGVGDEDAFAFPGPALRGEARIPLETMLDGRRLRVRGGGVWLDTEMTPWGAHAYTGHFEGDAKVNYEVHLLPRALARENPDLDIAGPRDGDGVCDPGEPCGVTGEVAWAHAPWYVAPHADTFLVDLEAPGGEADPAAGYLPGERAQFSLAMRAGELVYWLTHLGELAPAVVARLEAAHGSLDAALAGGLHAQPLPLVAGEPVARPQLVVRRRWTEDGTTYYHAAAQVEWNVAGVTREAQPPRWARCLYLDFPEADRQALQEALDEQLVNPMRHGRFLEWGFGSDRVSRYMLAQGRLCATEEVDPSHYGTLLTEGADSWKGTPMGHGEVLSLVPILTEAASFVASADRFPPGARYIFLRGVRDGSDPPIRIRLGGAEHRIALTRGDVLELDDPQAASGRLLVQHRSDDHAYLYGHEGADASAIDGAFQGATWRLEPDRLIVRWGDAASSRGAVVFPSPIGDAAVTCDGVDASCYDHDEPTH